jgi:hypothetical protein
MENLESGNFRVLLFFAAIPALISFYMCNYLMVETPIHAVSIGKPDDYKQAIDVMN